MKTYSIKEIERLTGIKAHTLRTWESRYHFLNPSRTDTNIRLYDSQHLKKLLNISLLINHGYKISQIAGMPEEEVKKALDDLNAITYSENYNLTLEVIINGLVSSMIELDENKFEKIFNTSILKMGLKETIIDVLYPLFLRLNIMWRTGELTKSQENFIYFLIRQKIIVAIDGLGTEEDYRRKVMIFLPETEYRDLEILMCIYLLKLSKFNILNIGQNVKLEEVVAVAKSYRPNYVLTFINTPGGYDATEKFIKRLSQNLPSTKTLLIGYDGLANTALNEMENIFSYDSLRKFSEDLSDL